jgi:heptosyltransferase-2
VSIHPGSGSPRKNWPAERYAELVRRLSPDRPWLLLLGPADEDGGRALAGVPGAVVARDLPPRAVGAIVAQAGVHVGNDSGLTHVAAAWGAPTIALFGPTDPAVWAPVGPQVGVVRASDGRMESIEVADVQAAATSEGRALPSR